MSASRTQFISPRSTARCNGAHGIVGTAPGPKTVGAVQEVLLVDGLQHRTHGVLDDLVLERRYAQRPRLAVVLRNVDPPDRLVTIALRPQPLVQVLDVSGQVLPVLLLRDPIHSDRRILALPVVGAGQGRLIQQMSQRVKLSVGFPSRSLRYPQKFRGHACPSRGLVHGSLLRFVWSTGRLRSTGFAGPPRYPASPLLCSPPTSLGRRPRLGFPSPLAYRVANACSGPAARAFANARRVGDLWSGFSAAPEYHEDRQGPPRLLGRPWQPRRGRPPRRVRRPLRPVAVTTTAAFRDGKPLGTREHKVYGAAFPTAQLLVRLRINRDVAIPTARLTTGLPGWALAGRDLHPQDDKPNLRKSPHDFLPSDQHCLVATQISPSPNGLALVSVQKRLQ